jgi:hypothetical protein
MVRRSGGRLWAWALAVAARDLDGHVPGGARRAIGHPGLSSVSHAGCGDRHGRFAFGELGFQANAVAAVLGRELPRCGMTQD